MERFNQQAIRSFWGRFYFPANATLYLVGDVDKAQARLLIEETFGRVPTPPPSQPPPGPGAAAFDAEVLLESGVAAEGGGSSAGAASSNGAGEGEDEGAAAEQQGAGSAAGSTSGNGAGAGEAPAFVNGVLLGAPMHEGRLVRRPVEHQWGCGTALHPAPVAGGAGPHRGGAAPVSVFRHRLLQLFQLSIFCKLPIRPMTTLKDLRCVSPAG